MNIVLDGVCFDGFRHHCKITIGCKNIDEAERLRQFYNSFTKISLSDANGYAGMISFEYLEVNVSIKGIMANIKFRWRD